MENALRQFEEFKRQYPDYLLLFRMGDFFEAFKQDAETLHRVTGVTLTTREHNGERIALAGVPYHSVEGYLRRLIVAGHRVAICEAVEDAAAKPAAKQEVTRLMVPASTEGVQGKLFEEAADAAH